MSDIIDEIIKAVDNDHVFTDSGCTCGFSYHQNPGTSHVSHRDRELVKTGRVTVVMSMLDFANNTLLEQNGAPESRIPAPMPTGIGAVVEFFLTETDPEFPGYLVRAVHSGNGHWYDQHNVQYSWADIADLNFNVIAEGQSFEDVSPSS